MADNVAYRFIQNVGDYFPSGYFTDDFADKVLRCAGRTPDDMKALNRPFVALRHDYEEYKNFIINGHPRTEDAIGRTHEWHTRLLSVLGYAPENPYQEPYVVAEREDGVCEMIPVRHILRSGDKVQMLIMEMQHLIAVGDTQPPGLFEQQYESEEKPSQREQRYYAGQWRQVIPAKYLDKQRYRFSPAIINKAITEIFLMPDERRPHYILMLSGNEMFLFDRDKWARGSYLEFTLDDLFFYGALKAARPNYGLFYLLAAKETLAADGQIVLMDTLIEDSFRNAYEVTKDLKKGVILAVETLANEALWYMQRNELPFGKKKEAPDGSITYDETDDEFEEEVKDDCLTIVYRLLFVLFAESRPELDILPTGDEVFKRGYSLEALRDLEQVRLRSQESIDGYFFDDSIRQLFRLLACGYHVEAPLANDRSFSVRPIDSPMFDDSRLHHLAPVRIRNAKWQEIIRALSLSWGKKYAGRISYANLGVNQLGAVYESLLSYRGFYAEEDYIEVFKPGHLDDGTFLVPYSRMEEFKIEEVLRNEETGEPKLLRKGAFVYRLNGRDRQKSASYYTPEVLTKSTVKYTIKAFIDEVRKGERPVAGLLDLKVLEPAVGAAAFVNEVINQLAEAYMANLGNKKKPAPDRYRNELQKVKAYIATHNVYGVDLNPTAIELGKLALWLNVIHKDMEAPFFANRLTVGNAVIGAWFKVYSRSEVAARTKGRKLIATEWWTKVPHKVKFYKNRVNRAADEVYHFLLPDKNMLGVLSIKEQRNNHPAEAARMREMMNTWTAPVSAEDFERLLRLSAKIDYLIREAYLTQKNIEALTNNRANIWGVGGDTALNMENYREKERIFNTRYRHDNAYFKLKMAMDYWCALWFWDYEHGNELPSRDDYWNDIEAMLDVDDKLLDRRTADALRSVSVDATGQQSLGFEEARQSDLFLRQPQSVYGARERQSEIIQRSKEELLARTKGKYRDFFDDSERFGFVKELADRYRFFHPMLEFIEVFQQRGGFDIICGNPPWIKYEFDERSVIAEKFPEVAIRRVSAPEVRTKLSRFLENDYLHRLYLDEQNEQICSAAFMSAFQNYPLLAGQKTNLYKCVLENTFSLVNEAGYIGLLTPEGIYTDPKGQALRRELYKRLRYHFQYQNELKLFAEVHHHTVYGDQLLGPRRSSSLRFASLSNLFHPNTVDACFAHDGHGECGGKKTESGNWNTAGHKDRIVQIEKKELQVLSDTFEDGTTGDSAPLVAMHSNEIMEVLEAFARFPAHVSDLRPIISSCWDETGAVDAGIIKRHTGYPDVENYGMVYNGPQFTLANPMSKSPRSVCKLNSDYDVVDLVAMSDDYSVRSNYRPLLSVDEYKSRIKGFPKGRDKGGKVVYEDWMDYYKLAFREFVGADSERTLICAVLPRKAAHIHAVISISFLNRYDCVDMAALCASLPMDFFVKTLGIQHVSPSRIAQFPLGIAPRYHSAMRSRCLRLNCLTTAYADLWSSVWDDAYKAEQWSIADPRLAPWDALGEEWTHATPLRNYFERRQALVEIDVIAAMALGLSLKDLETMYRIQFPVLQQNEDDTWYDATGNIVFTCSKGLNGVGLGRPQWEEMRGEPSPDGTVYAGTASEYLHTVDPAKSELYGGRQVTFHAPYTRCDRLADYRRAWAHFAARFDAAPSAPRSPGS